MDHPIFTGTKSTFLLTADHPKFPRASIYPSEMTEQEARNMLTKKLASLGYEVTVTEGRYEKNEVSLIVHTEKEQVMFLLASLFGQESLVWIPKGPHGYRDGRMVYVNGPNEGKYHPATSEYEVFPTKPNDMYTLVPGIGYLRLQFDWNTLLDPKED